MLHHLGFLVHDVDAWADKLAAARSPVWVRGRLELGPIKTDFAYMDTVEQAGLCIEFISDPNSPPSASRPKQPDCPRSLTTPRPMSYDERDLLYYSRDRGRYRPDGTLEILGRLDDQIKIRGARVEPGEIETALSQHPDVQKAVVVAREDGRAGDEKHLVAYVVPRRPDLALRDLHRYLLESVPGYMVPSVFARLDALPLTPNGKVDRRALPAPEADEAKE